MQNHTKKTETQAAKSSLPHSFQSPLNDADIEQLPKTLMAITKLFVENYEEKRVPIHQEVTDDYISDYRNMPNYLNRSGERVALLHIIQNHLQLYSVVEFAHTLSWMAAKILHKGLANKTIFTDERYFVLNLIHHFCCLQKAAYNPVKKLNIPLNKNPIHLTNKTHCYNLALFAELTELHNFFQNERENNNIPVRLFTLFVLKSMPVLNDMEIVLLTDTIEFINEFDYAA